MRTLCGQLGGPATALVRAASSAAADVPVFVNKNPRNLERLRLARKQQGWKLESDNKMFWNRVQFVAGPRHTTAFVEHCSGREVLSASTREVCLRRHLFSATDVSAAEAVGRVLARRCLQAGIAELQLDVTEEQLQRSDRLQLLKRALEEGGLQLQEPPEIRPEPWWTKHRELRPWHVPEQDVVS